jgi:hypothetical protein
LLLQWRLIGSTFPCSHQCVKWCTFDVGWHANCWHASCYLSASCATPEYGSHCWCPDCACTLGDRGTLRWHLKFSCKAAGHAVQLIVCNIPAMIATFLHCNKRLWFADIFHLTRALVVLTHYAEKHTSEICVVDCLH